MNTISEKRLTLVHPLLAQKIRTLASNLFTQKTIVIEVVQGLRTFAQQDELFAQGRSKLGHIVTNARGGHSNHNYGLAVDVCPFINGIPQWDDDKTFDVIGAAGEMLGLEWGGRWKKLIDKPHLQLPGLTISECLALFNEGGMDLVWTKASDVNAGDQPHN